MSPLFRRGGSLLVAATLTATTLTGSAGLSTASAAAPTYDDRPAAAAADWLTAQLTDGVVHNGQYDFDDIGLTVDVALGLVGLGGHDADVESISDSVAAHIDSYTTGADFDTADVYAGPTAKAMVLAQAAGDDATAYGGTNLVARLESMVSTDPLILGRIEDTVDPGNQYGADYANVLGQAYAAQGLAAAGSPRAADTLSFLLQQQCSDGYFRLYLTPDKSAADQSCAGGTAADESAPDTDATAAVVLALQPQADNPVVGSALDAAEAWLLAQQGSGGAFGGGPATEAPNTNSTGLAGWALGTLGDTHAAEAAAVWVRQRQVVNAGHCTLFDTPDVGATAYDDAGLKVARKGGISDASADQFRRATSQALPVLQWAPAARPDSTLVDPPRRPLYWQARQDAHFLFWGQTPGKSFCAERGTHQFQTAAMANGEVWGRVHLPRGTAIRRFDISSAEGDLGREVFRTLDRLAISFHRKTRVSRGDRQVVKARGLERHEHVTIRFRGKIVGGGVVRRDGTFVSRFQVSGKVGKARIRVLGEFPKIRHGSATFRVTR